MFKDFGKRLQRFEEHSLERIQLSERLSGLQSTGVDVQVISHKTKKRSLVWWFSFSSDIKFKSYCYTKSDYDEYGPSIVRNFSLFSVP